MSFDCIFNLSNMEVISKTGITVGFISLFFAFNWAFSQSKRKNAVDHEDHEDHEDNEDNKDNKDNEDHEDHEEHEEHEEHEDHEIQMSDLRLEELIDKRAELVRLENEIDSIQVLLDNLRKEVTSRIT
jgi:hypothetical protein